MRILVIGGAGYVGSHAARCLVEAGHSVWIYDNLSAGHRAACAASPLIVGQLADRQLLEKALRDHRIEAVIHFAAFASVSESVADPAKYYVNNVAGSLSLLEAMRVSGVRQIVFSSSCATYGLPSQTPITEDSTQVPVNPYGFTKLVIERALGDYAAAYGFGCSALRYFNAAGAHPQGDIGEDHSPETHLIPLALQVALGQRPAVTIFGDNYPTADGTCIRDYVHVDDLASAHLKALQRLQPGRIECLNLGTGIGHSVREVIDVSRAVTGNDIPVVIGERRPGDPPELVADARRAMKALDWTPRFRSIQSIIETAWVWHRSHPHGFST